MKRITFAISVAAFLISGCGNTTKEAKVIAEAPVPKPKAAPRATANTSVRQAPASRAGMPNDSVHQAVTKTHQAPAAPILSAFYTVFKDGAQIAPENGKPMLLVFGQPADPYTRKFQNDVIHTPSLAQAIQSITTPIYINAAAEKRHKFMHNGDMMEVDTKTLVSIYHIDATPTMIFTDTKAQSIFIVPGYMPPKQFAVTLQFLKEGVWKGKDRKNGGVYAALKNYYNAHGIQVGGAKK